MRPAALVVWFGAETLRIDDHPELGEIAFSGNQVSSEYLSTLGLSILQGRDFEELRPGHPPVVIINETAAKRYFGSGSPVGRYLSAPFLKQKWKIVGVVADVHEHGHRGEVGAQYHCPYWQGMGAGSFVELVRLATGAPVGLEALIRRTAYDVEPRLVVKVQRLSDAVWRDTLNERPRDNDFAGSVDSRGRTRGDGIIRGCHLCSRAATAGVWCTHCARSRACGSVATRAASWSGTCGGRHCGWTMRGVGAYPFFAKRAL